MSMESLGSRASEPFDEVSFFDGLEQDIRSQVSLEASEERLKLQAPEIYELISFESYRRAPTNLGDRQYYFREFLVMVTSEPEIISVDYPELDQAA